MCLWKLRIQLKPEPKIAVFFQLTALLPGETSLIGPFIDLIRGGESEVVGQLTKNLDKILPQLYSSAVKGSTWGEMDGQMDSNGNFQVKTLIFYQNICKIDAVDSEYKHILPIINSCEYPEQFIIYAKSTVFI